MNGIWVAPASCVVQIDLPTQILWNEAVWATKYGVGVFGILYVSCLSFCLYIWAYFSPFCGKPTRTSFQETHLNIFTATAVSYASINNMEPWVHRLKTNKLLECTGSTRQTITFREFLRFQKKNHGNITAVLFGCISIWMIFGPVISIDTGINQL